MKIGPETQPVTEISASNPETIVIRGYDLCKDLVGKIGFTEHVWLLITGALPNDRQRRMLDATLVAIAEHGLVPSVQASRMTLAAAPEALQGAVAAGILGCGSVVFGSAEAAGVFFSEIFSRQQQDGAGSLDEAIRATVRDYRAARRAIPGYGHPLHKRRDPRAERLFEYAGELGVAGKYVALAHQVEALLPELLKKPLTMNISGAIPAVLLDAGFPVKALKGVPILARTASLVGHLLEEQLRPIAFEMSHAASLAIRYEGPVPTGFVAAEE